MKNKNNIFIINIIAAIIMVLTIFLPFASANGNYAEGLSQFNMNIMSLSKFSKGYIYIMNNGGYGADECIIYIGIIGIFFALTIITLIANIRKHFKTTIVFSILSILIFSIIKWDFSVRNVVPGPRYSIGIGQYLFYIAAIVNIISVIYLKKLIKKEANK